MTQTIAEILEAFGALLPPEIEVEGSLETDVSLAFDAERAHASPMVQSRAEEFLTGRTCARRALRRLGVADSELLPLPNRAPAWPAQMCGSISHTKGICVVAVGRAADHFGIGIDVERREAVAQKLERYIATPAEAERFNGEVEDWRTIAFSTKEALFKCLNPPTALWLEFRQVELLSIDDTEFVARVSPKDHDPFEVAGRFMVAEAYVLSAVVLPAGWR